MFWIIYVAQSAKSLLSPSIFNLLDSLVVIVIKFLHIIHTSFVCSLHCCMCPVTTNQAGFTTDMLTQICSVVDSGTSFIQWRLSFCSQHRQHYWRLQWHFKEAWAQLGITSLSFPEFSQGTFLYSHEILLREIFMAYLSLFHHTFHRHGCLNFKLDFLWPHFWKCW